MRQHSVELVRLNGAVRVMLEELSVRQNYAEVDKILREVGRRLEKLIVDTTSNPT